MVNAPIVEDVLAVRVSAYDSYTPGYIDNAYTGASDTNAVRQTGERIALLWRPAASVAVKVTALWPRIDSDSEADVSSTGVAIVPDTDDANIVKASGSYGDLTEYHAFQATIHKEHRLLRGDPKLEPRLARDPLRDGVVAHPSHYCQRLHLEQWR
jgi:hypothetical protein